MIKRFIPKMIFSLICTDGDMVREDVSYHIALGYFEDHPRRPVDEIPAEVPKPKPKPRRKQQTKHKVKKIVPRDMEPMGKTFHSASPPPVNGFHYLHNPISGECMRQPVSQSFEERLRELLDGGYELVTKAEYEEAKRSK